MNTNNQSLKKGDKVIVRNQSISGESVIEGNATIVAVYNSQGHFRVRFDGDPQDETYIRFVNPEDKL